MLDKLLAAIEGGEAEGIEKLRERWREYLGVFAAPVLTMPTPDLLD